MQASAADTIVAIATPPGSGALGIVRVSGATALAVTRAVLSPSTDLTARASHTVRRVRLVDSVTGDPLDDALCTVMRGPSSYTGEDVVELSCHGSAALLAVVVERLCQAGARLATPGEFTRRAFVNGRVDLAQAEAVALLIAARSERAVTAAARAVHGELSDRLAHLRHDLLDVIAGLEVALDFPDDGVGLARGDAQALCAWLSNEARVLLRAARRGRRLHDGITVAIVGRTNAGKSTLFNALLGRNRAIVSPTPGTTRDVLEATLEIDGVAVRVLDTAGFGLPHDAVEAEGMARSHEAMKHSDLVVWLVDGSVPDDGDRIEAEGRTMIVVRSKGDLPLHPLALVPTGAVALSAGTAGGLDDFLSALRRAVKGVAGIDQEEGAVAASLRQHAGLESVVSCLEAAMRALDEAPPEVALVDLHEALGAVSSLLGMAVGDDVLDRIFSTFCVGK